MALEEGSSPLARGLPQPRCAASHLSRIIPARAGFTTGTVGRTSSSSDHPRSRGVYLVLVWLRWWIVGSSPLARGLLERRATAASQLRIIPARAGFTSRGTEVAFQVEDHPRSRGVYALLRTIR